jgi:hypothetical protein
LKFKIMLKGVVMNAHDQAGSIFAPAKGLIRTITLRRSCLILAFLWILATGSSAWAQTLAFPGAEGFGRFAKGGRGGRVIEVTNLNDSGPGSFRAACEASGPRTVVFRVGGTIVANSTINVTNPFITIAGQTAPGGGITLRNTSSNNRACFWVKSSDVIVRYLRVRAGVPDAPSSSSANFNVFDPNEPVRDVIVDHCSMSWGVDDTFSTARDTKNVTIQNCIISEALRVGTPNWPNPNSRNIVAGGNGNLTFYRNLFAHASERNPTLNGEGLADVINNVMYDTKLQVMLKEVNSAEVNVIGNFSKKGPSASSSGGYLVKVFKGEITNWKIFVEGNITPRRTEDTMAQDLCVSPETRIALVKSRLPTDPYPILSATDAYEEVLAGSGATLPARDEIDRRIVSDVRNRTGEIISDPNKVGGYGNFPVASHPADYDRDHDGMADSWEVAHGFNPNNAADGPQDADGDGYTNLEEYLNGLVPAGPGVPDPPGRPQNLRAVQ